MNISNICLFNKKKKIDINLDPMPLLKMFQYNPHNKQKMKSPCNHQTPHNNPNKLKKLIHGNLIQLKINIIQRDKNTSKLYHHQAQKKNQI